MPRKLARKKDTVRTVRTYKQSPIVLLIRLHTYTDMCIMYDRTGMILSTRTRRSVGIDRSRMSYACKYVL